MDIHSSYLNRKTIAYYTFENRVESLGQHVSLLRVNTTWENLGIEKQNRICGIHYTSKYIDEHTYYCTVTCEKMIFLHKLIEKHELAERNN